MSLLSQVPSIRAAIAEEAEKRDAAYTEAKADVAGVPLLPLTLRRYLVLCASQNAFVTGGELSPIEAAKFLWVLSDGYNGEGKGLDAFLAVIGAKNYGELLEGIGAYLDFAFFDAPAGDGDGRDVPSYYSLAAVYLDIFGREYGWGHAATLDCPLPVLFQQLKRIQQRNDPDCILFNPLSDRARADYVRQLNEGAA